MNCDHNMDDKNYTSIYILESLILNSSMVCKLYIEYSVDWVCNLMDAILSQVLFTLAYIYKCCDLYIALKNNSIIVEC